MRIEFTVEGPPVGKGRPQIDTRSGRMHEDAKTAKHEREVKKLVRAVFGPGDPWTCPVRIRVVSTSAIPPSWPKRYPNALANGTPLYDDGKPDGDNIEKLVWDACNEIVWRDDAQVVEWSGLKRYGSPARVDVMIEPVLDPTLAMPPMPTPAQLRREKEPWAEVVRRKAEAKAKRKQAAMEKRLMGATSANRFGGGRRGS